jgi:hypothetical protein
MTKAQRDIKRKLGVLNYAKEIGNVSKACRYYGISEKLSTPGKEHMRGMVKKP